MFVCVVVAGEEEEEETEADIVGGWWGGGVFLATMKNRVTYVYVTVWAAAITCLTVCEVCLCPDLVLSPKRSWAFHIHKLSRLCAHPINVYT